ncbi:hypothetical protein DN545_41320, partial [Burkholderia multivorans]
PPVPAAAESELAEADPADSEETEAHPAEAARTESDTWEPDRAPLTELELADVSVGWDGVPVLEDLALTADATAWTVVCGE